MKTNRRAFLGQLGFGLSALELKSQNYLSELPEESFWESIRSKFPLTDNRVYLNNGTFGPSPTPVLKAIKDSLDLTNITGKYGHTDKFRQALANFVKVSDKEISLTHNTTEGINIVCWGLNLKQEDEVIISLHEHVGNALPWINRAKLHGIKLIPFDPKPTAEENFDLLRSLITSKTKVIAIPHITCTTGQVFPIKEISALARSKGTFTAIDGAHGTGTFDLDLKELGCDSYATSCHKWMLGPNGTGFLYIREEHLDKIQAYQVGAYSDKGWDLYSNPPKIMGYNPSAHRFDYGSQSTPLYAGAAASATFHETIGKKKIENRLRDLSTYLYNGLSLFTDKLDILTPEEEKSRICMVTFKPKQQDYKAFSKKASQAGFRIRVVPESRLDAIRISTHVYNAKTQVEDFINFTKDTLYT
ncbi:MAG: cysteine desulfurase/selenocysteine lyase [Arcticibacterium sp.]|jgi:cysteine desulfurase/selenocysteine lyase